LCKLTPKKKEIIEISSSCKIAEICMRKLFTKNHICREIATLKEGVSSRKCHILKIIKKLYFCWLIQEVLCNKTGFRYLDANNTVYIKVEKND